MTADHEHQNLQVQIAVNLANQYLLTSFAGPDPVETDSAKTDSEMRFARSDLLQQAN
jgi:hypothetical protein